ncbi:MAG: leucine-rich repeat domain-containing protein, partial [Oscillospiraceae bacterium]|nr:leucine-rich repeat domain-containing protein [Oscillospiraceae bacterium]
MKRYISLIIFAALAAALLCGCQVGDEVSQMELPSPSPAVVKPPAAAIEEGFESILNGTEEIYLSGSADSAAINEISMLVGGVIEPRYCAVTKYCIADIDGDGEDELILWVSSAEEELYCTLIVKYNTGVERYCADVYMGDAMFRQIDSGSLQNNRGLVWLDYVAPNASKFGFDRLMSDNRFEYEILGDEELTIRRYIGSESDVTIPAEVNGLKVSSISYYTVDGENFGAFQGCNSIKSVNIPDGVELIYDDAFRDCTALESITIPASVRAIGNCAFSNC